MPATDWHKIRFLESSENLKPLVKMRFGREPSTSIARDIAACLVQGRLFYEAAVTSPLEIRPLQMFYGMVGFGKALVLARYCRSASTLPHAHGLKDQSRDNCRIAELRLRIDDGGSFQQFNEVVAELNRFCYLDESSKYRTVSLPSASSKSLIGLELSLRELLSRVPKLESTYRMTFGEEANTTYLGVSTVYREEGGFSVDVADAELFRDRESLKAIVVRWRERFPFLRNWRFVSGYQSYGRSNLQFRNVSPPDTDEFSETSLLVDEDNDFHAAESSDPRVYVAVEKAFSPTSDDGLYAVSPFSGQYVSEFSLHYMGLFLLSSLVRYRPQTWIHAISRSVVADMPADDQSLSLIERFLDINGSEIPEMVVSVLNPKEDRYA
jgi:hypothetical protein